MSVTLWSGKRSLTITSVFDPAYGLDEGTRYQALVDAENHGVKVAATMHNVSTPSIYRWRKEMIMKPAKETKNG
jgi:hypothetical protein